MLCDNTYLTCVEMDKFEIKLVLSIHVTLGTSCFTKIKMALNSYEELCTLDFLWIFERDEINSEAFLSNF